MKIVNKEVEELIPYTNNPKEHPESQINQIASSIKKFGFKVPILINEDNEIIAGHGRLQASKKLDRDKVPCIIADDLTETQEQAFRIADNKIAESGWDNDLLELELKELDEKDFDLELTGFNSEDINEFLREEKTINEDEVPEFEEKEEPKTDKGDIYKLGEHRLMCGDSSKEKNIEELMQDKEIKTIFTSPPYNMAGDMYEDYSDNMKSEKYIEFNINIVNKWKKYLKGYIFWNLSYNKNSRDDFLKIMSRMTEETKLRFLELIVWNKKTATPIKSKDMLTRTHEPILMIGNEEQVKQETDMLWFGTVKKKARLYKDDYTGYTNFWEVKPNNVQLDELKACFPVEIPSKGIMMTTNEGDIVADPFSGSGSTLIACEQTDRVFYGMELNPKYCDIIVNRWEEFTGQKSEKLTD